MRAILIRSVQTFALAAICIALFAGPSAAERQTARQVQTFCNQAGGSFSMERNGNYSCYLPAVGSLDATWKYCTADGRCNFTAYCGGRPCTGTKGKRESTTKKPGKPKPTKREDGVMTAGTAGDRAGKTAGAKAGANLNANIGTAPAKTSSSTGAASSVGNNSIGTKPVGAKPSSFIGAASVFRKPGQVSKN